MSSASGFSGTARFELRGRLGEGGMGVVYRAWDNEQGLEVALKRLHAMDADALLQLKTEFRRMRDIVHENLVTLGELVHEQEQWFFTMELVEGADLLKALRPDWSHPASNSRSGARSGTATATARLETRPATSPTLPLAQETLALIAAVAAGEARAASPETGEASAAPAAPLWDWERLRGLFLQLVEGVSALHRQGILHRDIKPPNIRVTPKGRLVLLDFGIAEAVSRAEKERSTSKSPVFGTPLYMAPELYSGGDAGTAADWYSVGMVLYQALVGRPPVLGSSADVMRYKALFDLPSPRTWSDSVPEDLDELCMKLLSRNPEARPDVTELTRWLERRSPSGRLRRRPIDTPSEPAVFVGRERELEVIQAAFRSVRRETQAAAVVVQGASGLGKTVLAQRSVDALLQGTPEALVLQGRSHERESVPFKAFDGIVDELTGFLRTLEPSERDALTPDNAELLGHLFPVLAQLEGYKPSGDGAAKALEPAEFRRRSFGALRELLVRLTRTRPLILLLDDLHWADADSLQLLRELMRSPGAPPALLLATVRPGADGDWHPPRGTADNLFDGALQRVKLLPLETEEVHKLVRQLAPGDAAVSRQLYRLSEESGGHPLYLRELMRHLQTHGTLSAASVTLDEALWQRAERLQPEDRRLLQLVALAGRPLPNETLRCASELAPERFSQAVRLLSQTQLIRTAGVRRDDALEPYHDRIRESVVSHLQSTERPALHRQLAVALEQVGPSEPETIAIHWGGAGDTARALTYAQRAALAAEATFAFDRAKRLYQYCLSLCEAPEQRRHLRTRLAWSLVNLGNNREAGEAFLAASEGAEGHEAIALKRLAAEKLLEGGDVERGLPQMGEAMAAAGMRFVNNPLRALVPLAWLRARVAFRGLSYKLRRESEVPRRLLAKMDAAQSCANVMAFLSPVCSLIYGAQFLLMALKAGERVRLSRALSSEYFLVCASARPNDERGRAIIDQAESLAREAGDKRALAHAYTQKAFLVYVRDGHFGAALEIANEAEQILRGECHGVTYELATLAQLVTCCSWYTGRWANMQARTFRERKEALERGDHWTAANVCSGGANCSYLMQDDSVEARRQLDEGRRTIPEGRMYLSTLLNLNARCNLDLYERRALEIHREMESSWKAIRRAFLHLAPLVAVVEQEMRGRAAVGAAAYARGSEQKQMHRIARHTARASRKLRFSISRPLGDLTEAAVLHQEGRDAQAIALLQKAEAAFGAAGTHFYAAFAQCARGRLTGGDEGRALLATACETIAAQGVRRPERMADAFAPGFGLEG